MSVIKNKVKKELNLMRHSERSEESMDPSVGVAFLKDDNWAGQRGRSMVEMLGVLAIVGVLSVGGVSAYGIAMKKHKANELLQQASMLATTISVQAMTNEGALPQTITSFGNSSYGNFSTSVSNALNGKGFSITIKNVDSGACTQLEKMAGGMVQGVNCKAGSSDDKKNAEITYYKNLATTEAEGAKSPTGEKPDPACADVTCPEGSTCSHGQCQCSNGLFVCGTQCCAEGTYCTQGADSSTYVCAVPTGECSSNSDCGEDEYCHFSGGDCSGPTGGTCTDKGTLTPTTFNLPKGDLTVYKGGGTNWWSTSNLCQAHGKQMVTMSDLGIAGQNCSYFDSAKRVDFGDNETYQCNCTADSDCSKTTTELYKLGTSGFLWLADNSKQGPCYARSVLLDNGYISNSDRDMDASYGHYALCR